MFSKFATKWSPCVWSLHIPLPAPWQVEALPALQQYWPSSVKMTGPICCSASVSRIVDRRPIQTPW